MKKLLSIIMSIIMLLSLTAGMDFSSFAASSIVFGDINNDGAVNITDSVNIINYVNGITSFTAEQKILADVDFDGNVTANDSELINDYIANGTVFPAYSYISSQGTSDDVGYAVFSNGTVLIYGSGKMKDYGSILTTSPFRGKTNINKVVFGDGVTNIGNNAFYNCTNLSSITISKTVIDMEYKSSSSSWLSSNGCAFTGCTGIDSIVVESGNPAFDSRDNCNSIIETETNTLVVGSNNSTVPATVNSIADYAFFGCNGLTQINIPSSVYNIGTYAFSECIALSKVTLPSTINSIRNYTFDGCSKLTDISIPDSVTSIGIYAFRDCSSITNIAISSAVTSIGRCAFGGCTGVTGIAVDSNNTVYDSRNNCNAIIKTNNNELIAGCKNSIIPNTVTSIGSYAFYSCLDLTKMTIPYSVTEIGSNAFSYCSGLTSVTLPDSVTSIPSYAFRGCTSLTSVTIPSTVTSIGSYAFNGCSGLTKLIVVSKTCEFSDSTNTVPDNTTIYGYTGSTAETYASTYSKTFVAIDSYTCSGNHLPAAPVDSGKVTPTCTINGQYTRTIKCVKCGITISTSKVTIPALGHNYAPDETVAPTCVDAGYIKHTCLRCDYSYNSDYTDALGHNMVKINAKAPDCTNNGNNDYYTCIRCGGVFKDEAGNVETSVEAETLKALGHDWMLIDAGIPATCSSTGVSETYECRRCHITDGGATIPATPHDYTETVKEPNCTEQGYTEYFCTNCGYTYTGNYKNALGHDLVTESSASATCTTPGMTEKKRCTRCDYTEGGEMVASLGHNMIRTESKAATCTEAGNNEYWTCARCGKVFKDAYGNTETTVSAQVISKLGHSFTSSVISPNCTEQGYTAYTCTRCGYSYNGNYTSPLGHSYDSVVIAVNATCTEDGVRETRCSRCGKVYNSETIPKLGHSFKESEQYCLNGCGTKNPDYVAPPEPATTSHIHTAGAAYKTNIVKATPSSHGSYDLVTSCSECSEIMSSKTVFVDEPVVTLDITSLVYTGKNLRSAVICDSAEHTEIYPASSKKVGRYSVTVNLSGELYEGSVKLTYDIVPKTTKIKSAKAKGKKVSLNWKKLKGVSGYEIQVSKKKDFSKNTKRYSAPKRVVSGSFKIAKKGKYYVRIRTYTFVNFNGQRIKLYSPWSKAKKVK